VLDSVLSECLEGLSAALIFNLVEPAILERSEHPVSRRDIDANVLKVLYRLINAGHTAYLVGGSVRDLIIGRRPKDFDVATSAHPHQVRGLFRNSRLIGRRFRLVHVFFGPQNVEVATFRQRSEEVGELGDPLIRHDNTFGSPEEDAFRRDFTVNALFYDPRTFRLIDHTGGVADLRRGVIRSIGDPELRMREDPIRMVRAVRFAAKLGFDIEAATSRAIERHCGDLARASVPRLIEETYRTLGLAGAAQALVLMEQLGLLAHLLPFVSMHLRSGDRLEAARTVRNLAAMGSAIADRSEASHPLILAGLMADLHLTAAEQPPGESRANLMEALRERGFSRVDTEHMRLLLDAVQHMLRRSRVTRRLARRPYFFEARRLFASIAPNYGADPAELDRFLASPPEHIANRRRGAAQAENTVKAAPRRRRRRRRRGKLGTGASPGAPTVESSASAGDEIRSVASAGPGQSEGSMPNGSDAQTQALKSPL